MPKKPKKLPKPARGMIPVLSYETPDIRDLIVYLEVQSQHANYNAPTYGSLYAGPGTKYATYELVYVSTVDENGVVKWFYAAPRSGQGAYNFKHGTPPASSGGFPSYSRTYFVPRSNVGDYFDGCELETFTTSVTPGSLTPPLLPPHQDQTGFFLVDDVPSFATIGDSVNISGADSYVASGDYIIGSGTFVLGSSNSLYVDGIVGFLGPAPSGVVVKFTGSSVGSAGSAYLAPGAADPDLSYNPEWCGYSFTSQEVSRVPNKELDSLYVLITRNFENLCTQSGQRLNNRTGELESFTNQVVPNADLATSGINSDGVATTSSPINCDFSMQTTSTVRPITTLSYDSTINYSWPAVLDYVDMLSWSLLDGSSSRYYPRLVWKRNAYNGPTRVTITETWSKNPPTVPEIVTLETTAVLFACPLYSVNTGPCLHEEAWFNCGFGTNDPVWKWQNVVRSTSATRYTDWPTGPFIAAATVTNTNGGFLLRTLTINGRPPAYSAPSAPLVAGFAVAPYATGSTSIKMVASLGGASVLPVSFYFSETSGNPGGADSGWQTSNTYTNTGLSAGTQYTYTVKMRDGDVPPTEGPESSAAVATTDV